MSKSTAVRIEAPYQQLRISARNTRKGRDTEAHKLKVSELAESIAQVGLLQNLVVHVEGDYLDVDAGGTRFEAIGQLIADGRWPADQGVPVLVIGIDEAIAASYTENSKRTAMHPADEYEAFVALTTQGWTIDQIADKFGVTPLVVERRIKLQAAAPELLHQFRENLITTDQLIALCSTDSHERQLNAWNAGEGRSWMRSPHELRAAVMSNEVEADKNPHVDFIGGVEVYEKAGGGVRRDLFSDEGHGVILEDSGLLLKLVYQKLEEIAEQYRKAGWKWVEVWPQFDYSEYSRYGIAPKVAVVLTEELAESRNALIAQMKALEDAIDSIDDDQDAQYVELDEQHDALQEQLDELDAQGCEYSPEVIGHTGVIVAFQYNGLRIERGLVKTEDRAEVSALLGDNHAILGGRESKPAGRKADAVSDALRQSLLGYKNHAAQVVTAQNPHAAKALLVSQMVTSIRGSHSVAPTDYSISNGWGTRTYCKITDDAGIAQQAAFEASGETLISTLPSDEDELWNALYDLPATELDTLLAFAVARSVSLASEPGRGMTDAFVATLGLDMAEHFTPTAANYLGRVSKDLILAALDEAEMVRGDADREALMAMKKGALAKEAEARLAETGWVPGLIRTVKKSEPVKTIRKPSRKAKA